MNDRALVSLVLSNLWHPATKLPTPGVFVLCATPEWANCHVHVGYFSETANHWCLSYLTAAQNRHVFVSHWMPLPPEPSDARQKAGEYRDKLLAGFDVTPQPARRKKVA